MGVLTAIRKQDNPDGVEGHEERLRMQEESKSFPPKRVFTRGKSFHNYSPYDFRHKSVDKERLLFAKQFCQNLCLNTDCPFWGI